MYGTPPASYFVHEHFLANYTSQDGNYSISQGIRAETVVLEWHAAGKSVRAKVFIAGYLYVIIWSLLYISWNTLGYSCG